MSPIWLTLYLYVIFKIILKVEEDISDYPQHHHETGRNSVNLGSDDQKSKKNSSIHDYRLELEEKRMVIKLLDVQICHSFIIGDCYYIFRILIFGVFH